MVSIATLLLEEIGRSQLNDLNVSAQFGMPTAHGRLLMTKWISGRIASHPDVASFVTVGELGKSIDSASPLAWSDLPQWFTNHEDAVWFEPARHYWWKPGVVRQALGRSFPIVTMMHSIGYSAHVGALIASCLTPQLPGDRIIAPSKVAKQVFLTQCESVNQLLRQTMPLPQVDVVPYGVPPVTRTPHLLARTACGWDDRPVVLFVGRLNRRDKADFDALFESSARLLANGFSFRLVLAGFCTPTEAAELRACAARAGLLGVLELRPNVSETEKHLLLSACDVFVSPSNTISESFGLSIVEAMLHARPVLCSSWSGYREIVRDGVDGFLVDTWWNADAAEVLELPFVTQGIASHGTTVALDIDQLTNRLGMLISDSDLRQRLGETGYARASSKFLIERVTRDVMSLLIQARTECPVRRSSQTSPPRMFSPFSHFATRFWEGRETLRLARTVDIEREFRMGTVETQEQASILETARSGENIAGLDADAFHLFRLGLLTVGDQDRLSH